MHGRERKMEVRSGEEEDLELQVINWRDLPCRVDLRWESRRVEL